MILMMKIMRVIMIRHKLKNPNQIISMKWIIMMLNIMAKIIMAKLIQGKNIRKIKPYIFIR